METGRGSFKIRSKYQYDAKANRIEITEIPYTTTVEKIKENDKFRRDYTAMNLHDFDITEEAKKQGRIEGLNEGLELGTQQKAVEGAIILIKDFNAEPELAATKMNAPLEKVLEALKSK